MALLKTADSMLCGLISVVTADILQPVIWKPAQIGQTLRDFSYLDQLNIF